MGTKMSLLRRAWIALKSLSLASIYGLLLGSLLIFNDILIDNIQTARETLQHSQIESNLRWEVERLGLSMSRTEEERAMYRRNMDMLAKVIQNNETVISKGNIQEDLQKMLKYLLAGVPAIAFTLSDLLKSSARGIAVYFRKFGVVSMLGIEIVYVILIYMK